MSVVVIGLQHTQAPLPLLEAAAVPDADLHKALSALSHRRNVQEAVVLSTCLRTEVYAVVDRFHDAVAEIYDVLSEHSGLSVEELSAHATVRFDDDVTSHLFSVTSGLESVVTGETEVVGQVRRAFERAQEEGTSRARPLRALPARAADGQAGAHRDGHQQGHDVVRLRRRDGRPRRGPGGSARRPRRGRRARATWASACAAPCRTSRRPTRRSAVVVVNRSAARARDLVRQTATGPFDMRAAPLERRRRRAGRRRRRPDRRGRRVPRARCGRLRRASPAPCS